MVKTKGGRAGGAFKSKKMRVNMVFWAENFRLKKAYYSLSAVTSPIKHAFDCAFREAILEWRFYFYEGKHDKGID